MLIVCQSLKIPQRQPFLARSFHGGHHVPSQSHIVGKQNLNKYDIHIRIIYIIYIYIYIIRIHTVNIHINPYNCEIDSHRFWATGNVKVFSKIPRVSSTFFPPVRCTVPTEFQAFCTRQWARVLGYVSSCLHGASVWKRITNAQRSNKREEMISLSQVGYNMLMEPKY